jgi:Flp pilus assembly protein protease CpaA
MYEIIFLFILGFFYILFAVIQDLKSREIANWLNFSLIIFALGFRFFYSLFSNNLNFFIQGIFGLLIFFLLGNFFYYSRFFAGGDAKLLIALGTILPLNISFNQNLSLFVFFILIFFISSLIYSFPLLIFLSIKNYKKIKKDFINSLKNYKKFNKLILLIFIILSLINFLFIHQLYFFIFSLFLILFFYSYIYSKSLDKVCMIKEIPSNKLTEGDWLYEDIKINNEIIKSKWDGLSKEEIIKIKRHIKNVKIREGIPFSPVFLISFISYLIFLIFFKEFFLESIIFLL